MGKLEWGTILVLCGLSVGSIRADDGRQRSIAAEEIQVKEYVMGTTSRIDGMRLRMSEDPDPMACATSGIKMVEIVEPPRCFEAMLRLATTISNPETMSSWTQLKSQRFENRLKSGFKS